MYLLACMHASARECESMLVCQKAFLNVIVLNAMSVFNLQLYKNNIFWTIIMQFKQLGKLVVVIYINFIISN